MTPPIEQETLFAELDQLLEPEIEARLRSGIYGEKKRLLVQLYLDHKALGRSAAQVRRDGTTFKEEEIPMRETNEPLPPWLRKIYERAMISIGVGLMFALWLIVVGLLMDTEIPPTQMLVD